MEPEITSMVEPEIEDSEPDLEPNQPVIFEKYQKPKSQQPEPELDQTPENQPEIHHKEPELEQTPENQENQPEIHHKEPELDQTPENQPKEISPKIASHPEITITQSDPVEDISIVPISPPSGRKSSSSS
uniref:Uncharacterized protein n=1 Tax=Ciona savignyi TaxID=51511 RepID=H2YI85_CIOSA